MPIHLQYASPYSLRNYTVSKDKQSNAPLHSFLYLYLRNS